MSGKRGRAFWNLEIYARYEELSNLLWDIVDGWSRRHQNLIGAQLLRAVDSIGANIAESCGRGHFRDSLKFLYYARGSMNETQHWMRRAVSRNLAGDHIEEIRNLGLSLAKQLNAFIRSQRPLVTDVDDAQACQEAESKYGIFEDQDFTWLTLNDRASSRLPRAKSQEPRATSRSPRATSQEPTHELP